MGQLKRWYTVNMDRKGLIREEDLPVVVTFIKKMGNKN